MNSLVMESILVVLLALIVGVGLGWLAWHPRSPLRSNTYAVAERKAMVAESERLHSSIAEAQSRETALLRDMAAMRDELVERYEELAMRGNERDAARAALRRSQLELAQRTEEVGEAHALVEQLRLSRPEEERHVG